jgi:hypothetical protein
MPINYPRISHICLSFLELTQNPSPAGHSSQRSAQRRRTELKTSWAFECAEKGAASRSRDLIRAANALRSMWLKPPTGILNGPITSPITLANQAQRSSTLPLGIWPSFLEQSQGRTKKIRRRRLLVRITGIPVNCAHSEASGPPRQPRHRALASRVKQLSHAHPHNKKKRNAVRTASR